ncbi:hypothetical protein Hanom_Chr03g00178811 [Helianthus anomalus]
MFGTHDDSAAYSSTGPDSTQGRSSSTRLSYPCFQARAWASSALFYKHSLSLYQCLPNVRTTDELRLA